MLLNAKRSGEQNWQSRPRPRVISTVPPATSLSLSPGISSDFRGISTTLAGGPAAYRVSEKRAGKTFSASPSTRQSTPQRAYKMFIRMFAQLPYIPGPPIISAGS